MGLNDSDPIELRISLLAGSLTDKGPQPPLLVVGPSLGTSVTALWEPALPWLSEQFTVIGWDLPGHGASDPSAHPFTIEQLADAVEAAVASQLSASGLPADHPRYHAGVSISGTVTLELALREPATFDALAMICSAAKIGEPTMWKERADLVARAGTPTMVEGSAQRWFADGFMGEHPDVAANLLRSLQHTDRHSYAHACHALSRFDHRSRLHDAARPLLAVAGDQDSVCPPSEAKFIAENVPGAHAEVLAGVAHLAPAEAPEKTAQLLKEHFIG